ncbi:cell division protein FtsZ [Cardiobacterium valvarum]|uniref:Cell division protein FtsZ n=1 Tax=Cardiobacterium valvarum F0432 TaxID=797473 RepID=G9ZID1_9GAMM|nr:cell division protein FtsZ [Cardiobacterium valvarum]EHM52167.1 cell division protein FtsZ [Cardiobacterium valvarum F0432]
MAFTIQMDETDNTSPVMIKVIGIGGGGCNALKQMMDFDLQGVELIVANTDKQVLQENPIQNKLQLGVKTTRGMGAGSKPEVGRQAAEEDRDKIRDALNGADMVFIAAGMGGGTGTGAAPVIANVARDMGILTVAIVTKPFTFEGVPRMRKAEAGIEVLKSEVDCLVVIPNDRITSVMGEDATLIGSFKAVDNVLRDAVYSIATIIQKLGVINTDLEDVKTIMSERGIAMMGSGEAKGEDRARAATERAISSPLLENIDLASARGLLVNVSASSSVKTAEYHMVGHVIYDIIDPEQVNLKIGLIVDDNMGDTLRVTVVATGIESSDDNGYFGDTFGTYANSNNSSSGSRNTGYTDLSDLGFGVRANSDNNTYDDSADDRSDYRNDNDSGGFSLSKILRRRTH